MSVLLGLVGLVAGLYLGEKFPDVDQRVEWLLHRSALTHGLLLPVLLYFASSATGWRWLRLLVLGVCLGMAVHLAFDLFPRGWTGYALISVPGLGWLPAPLSWAWIAGSGMVCLFLAGRLARGFVEWVLRVAALLGVFIFTAQGEEALWRPLAALVVGLAIVGMMGLTGWLLKGSDTR